MKNLNDVLDLVEFDEFFTFKFNHFIKQNGVVSLFLQKEFKSHVRMAKFIFETQKQIQYTILFFDLTIVSMI